MEQVEKLTENQTIIILMKHLKNDGWDIDSYCLGQTKGCDIIASRQGEKLLIEAKGAKADNDSPTKRREYFDSGQIKDHFGKAIVKILSDKLIYPDASFGIAHPDDAKIRKSIGKLIPSLLEMGIRHFWVSSDGSVLED